VPARVVDTDDDQRLHLAASDQTIGCIVHLPFLGFPHRRTDIEQVLSVIQVQHRIGRRCIPCVAIPLRKENPKLARIVKDRAPEFTNLETTGSRALGGGIARTLR
jgi:hypothetical protein